MVTALHIERVFDREDALGLKAAADAAGPRTTGMLTMAAGGTTVDWLSVEAPDRRGLDAAACEHAAGDCEYDRMLQGGRRCG